MWTCYTNGMLILSKPLVIVQEVSRSNLFANINVIPRKPNTAEIGYVLESFRHHG